MSQNGRQYRSHPVFSLLLLSNANLIYGAEIRTGESGVADLEPDPHYFGKPVPDPR